MSHLIWTYTVSAIEITIGSSTRTDVGKSIDSTYKDEKTHLSHHIRSYTVHTIEITIRPKTRTDVG